MNFITDNRGVSEVVGAILVFGLFVALLAVFQTTAIPAANEEVEFKHSQQVQSDLVEFSSATSRVSSSGDPESVKVQMGTSYPTRLLFFNPQNPTGQIRLAGNQTASIQNVTATDEETREYIDGSITNLEAKRLEYSANYNEYQDPPTNILEYGTVYRAFDNQTVIDDPGKVVSGNDISLTLFAGNLSRASGGSLSLEAEPTSAPARTVTVEPSGGPMVLRLPSRLNASRWEELLSEEENVEDVRSAGGGDFVEIELNETKEYNLRMPQIGVGSDTPDTEATYVTRASNRQLQIGEANRLPIEVRDRYNNPVSGESINISVDTGQFQNGNQTIETTTTDDGQPSARYTGSGAGVVEVKASYTRKPSNSTFNPDNTEDIRFNVSFNPRLDQTDPTIQDATLSEDAFTVCTSFDDVTIPVISDTVTSCLTTATVSQMIVDYDVTDTGGSGLDYIELAVVDSNGNTLMNSTERVQGAQSQGIFRSPQINHDEAGEPTSVDIRVYDRNGNSDNTTEDLP